MKCIEVTDDSVDSIYTNQTTLLNLMDMHWLLKTLI